MNTEKLIDAAEKYADAYDEDERECIKTDVMNAFYAGAAYGAQISTEKPGETGNFPEGKLNSDDEGELRMSLSEEAGNVVLRFGKSVGWIGFPPHQAREFAAMLVEYANAIEN